VLPVGIIKTQIRRRIKVDKEVGPLLTQKVRDKRSLEKVTPQNIAI
jgi:hypothetical protein